MPPPKLDAEAIVVDPKYFADRAKTGHTSLEESMRQCARSPEPFGMWTQDHKERFFTQGNQTLSSYKWSQQDKSMTSEMTLKDTRKNIAHPIYRLRKGEEWNTMLETYYERVMLVYTIP